MHRPAPMKIPVLISILVIITTFLAACGTGPKAKASQWADRFPPEVGPWELDDKHLELTAENQSNYGHVTLTYEGDDDILAYVSIDAFATQTAAEVEMAARLREWQLEGIRFEKENSADIATTPGGFLSFYQESNVILTLTVIPPLLEAEKDSTSAPTFAPLPDEDVLLLVDIMVKVAKEE